MCSRCACLIGFSPRVLIGYTIDMDQDDSDEEDEAVNFLSFLRNQTDDITVEDEFDDETEEEDLAKLFGDSESVSNDPDGAKGGA